MWKAFDVSEGSDDMLSRARRNEIERHNDEVRQNRGMLRTLSEVVLYLSKQELPFRGHDESSGSLNRGNYREPLECFSKFDTVFERRLYSKVAESKRGDVGVFTGVSSDTQNDLNECLDSQGRIQHQNLTIVHGNGRGQVTTPIIKIRIMCYL